MPGDIRMLMIAPAPAILDGEEVFIDSKFASGMALQSGLFPGTFDCILRQHAGPIPFGRVRYERGTAGFGLRVIGADAPLTVADLEGYDLVLVSADDDRNLRLAPLARAAVVRLAATLEYSLQTRLDIARIELAQNPPRRLIRGLRLRLRERRRHALLAAAAGLQANGYPAQALCQRFDSQSLMYLDNRMTRDLYATDAEMADRTARLQRGAPLRLVYSGRLERMKGAQDLVPVAEALVRREVPFRLDIFGSGSLSESIAAQIAGAGLGDRVQLHGALDFEKELVPHLRRKADIFLCCHPQADPSCTYIESMACGLAVAGYDNQMWRALQADSRGGWVSPLGRPADLAARIADLNDDRSHLAVTCGLALGFAKGHDFETLSARRMAHLAALASS